MKNPDFIATFHVKCQDFQTYFTWILFGIPANFSVLLWKSFFCLGQEKKKQKQKQKTKNKTKQDKKQTNKQKPPSIGGGRFLSGTAH